MHVSEPSRPQSEPRDSEPRQSEPRLPIPWLRERARGAWRPAVLLAFALLLLPLSVSASAASEAESTPAERAEVGDEAPVILLADPSGEMHDSSELVGKKKLIAIFFRGAW